LQSLNLKYPELDENQNKNLNVYREQLMKD